MFIQQAISIITLAGSLAAVAVFLFPPATPPQKTNPDSDSDSYPGANTSKNPIYLVSGMLIQIISTSTHSGPEPKQTPTKKPNSFSFSWLIIVLMVGGVLAIWFDLQKPINVPLTPTPHEPVSIEQPPPAPILPNQS